MVVQMGLGLCSPLLPVPSRGTRIKRGDGGLEDSVKPQPDEPVALCNNTSRLTRDYYVRVRLFLLMSTCRLEIGTDGTVRTRRDHGPQAGHC